MRAILRRLREIMAEPGDGQSRLNHIVQQIAGFMVAEVCSIYLKRQDGMLELFATEGLNPGAVHNTFMRRGEGLVGRCAELAAPVNEPDAQSHPAFSYRPETGEEPFHSFLAVPILRAGDVLGVLTVQNKTAKEYSDEELEVLETTAMVLAEHLVSGAVSGTNTAAAQSRAVGHIIKAPAIAEGIALGHVVLHEPRVVVTETAADDPVAEALRLDLALDELRGNLDELLDQDAIAHAGEHRDVLEAYRMFARDRGWQRRLREAVATGLNAEAAVELVQNQQRARMLRQADHFWRERLRDLDELSDRLMRILAARRDGGSTRKELPADAVVVARSMGAADLLDYDRAKLRGLIIEDGGDASHVAIVARALGIAAVGQARGIIERVDPGDAIIVDAQSGEIYVRPSSEVVAAYTDKVRFLAGRQKAYASLRGLPAQSKDGIRVDLQLNSGLLVDMAHLEATGADGVGLFRTELQFMVASTFPRLERQTELYRSVLDAAGGKPVIFRTLDIGADKILPYLRHQEEPNPALGWRGVRMGLDRQALLRIQLRALIKAAGDREISLMLPMVATAFEVDAARGLLDREIELHVRRGGTPPARIHFGIMIEVPSVLYDLDTILRKVDFVSVGSNDLMQYLFAADRDNERVANRFDVLSPPALRALAAIPEAAARHRIPARLCGEIGG
ncbi:MAG TPA: phosphoenolpyruvate-utilizing N-terminal domain-containing protein, partial [Hyphomicrobiaceae bacterium]|nr:phosphoenolpyruvate-utilizing N-terminal domain-containing protein [Hyphomicrobiaceae bacterium]